MPCVTLTCHIPNCFDAPHPPTHSMCITAHSFPQVFQQLLCQKAHLRDFQSKGASAESLLKCINNHSFGLFIIVQRLIGAWFEDHRLLDEMCLFSSTPESVLCAHLRAEFGHVWLVDYNKHMGKMAENAQILKPYVAAWETMPY